MVQLEEAEKGYQERYQSDAVNENEVSVNVSDQMTAVNGTMTSQDYLPQNKVKSPTKKQFREIIE